ncbi:hypothetical protein IPC510_27185 [Pseudomonas aeruginosa]|uniref:aromatic-ring-hydroxylating dioxygenase subunit beta n=1 Tax=Pseudomonas aeruginosa TaxID=287 RepID=UPI000F5255FC|nr:aromatic-ring-hydroxylating dioxygenase subunit beta [Pseudomonas aeruginosa]RPZ96017.1 hypothetical protein IPC510_27185 [Pseudomonas aeruginosa]
MSLALSRPDSDLLARVSDFLVAEAELLDDRLLDTWFALFERAARYRVLPLQEQLAGQAPEDSLYNGPEGLRIVSREIRLDHETISAQRRISIIL